jgi:hypothetical protein
MSAVQLWVRKTKDHCSSSLNAKQFDVREDVADCGSVMSAFHCSSMSVIDRD